MTTNHTELCFLLRHMGSPRAELAADLIEQQAARIQQQAERIAELEKDCASLIHDNAQLLKAARAEATLASEALAERDALKADAERYRWLRQDRTEDQTRAVIDIIIDNCDEYMDDAIDAAIQAEKETRS